MFTYVQDAKINGRNKLFSKRCSKYGVKKGDTSTVVCCGLTKAPS
jgi:hypothetical protein